MQKKIMLIANGTSFGIQDPIFGLDIAYYMFQKPVIETLALYFVILFVGLSIYIALYYVIAFNRYFDGVDGKMLKRKLVYEKINKKCIINNNRNCNSYSNKYSKYNVWKNSNC